MTANINKLKGKIAERGMTQISLSNALQMSPSTLHRKIKSGGLGFSIGEIHRLAEILHLTQTETDEIFLYENSH